MTLYGTPVSRENWRKPAPRSRQASMISLRDSLSKACTFNGSASVCTDMCGSGADHYGKALSASVGRALRLLGGLNNKVPQKAKVK